MSEGEFCITMKDIYDARERIKDEAQVTPLTHYDNLASLCGCKLWLKLETQQRCKAFKFRGALNKLRTMPKGSTAVAVSAGNHSQGVALAATLCDCKSIIYMPENATVAKVQATQHYGGTVVQRGATFDDAKNACEEDRKSHPEWVFVSPYNDEKIIAGTGTIGLEIFEQLPEVDVIVVPIGGGGLISGIAYAIKQLKPTCRIVGVNMASCPYTYKAFMQAKGLPITHLTKETPTPLADGIAVKSPGDLNMAIIMKLVDEVVVVTEDEVALSVAFLAERGKIIAEGAGAAAFAAIYTHKFKFDKKDNVVGIVSGGNIPLRMLARCIERALFLRGSRVSINIVLPYGTQHLAALLDLLSINHADVVSCLSQPHVDTVANKEHYELIIDVASPDSLKKLEAAFEQKGWHFTISKTDASDE